MTTTAPTPEVWFLTGSQGLYGPETLDQVADQSRAIALLGRALKHAEAAHDSRAVEPTRGRYTKAPA